MYKSVIKRAIDLLLSFLGSIILLPVFVVVGVLLYLDDPGPVFFKQKRIGKNKKIFWLHKFRSMKMNTPDVPTHLLDNPEQYITKLGRFIRKFSIDELPQVFDILIGNMAIIGPRPALWNQEDLIAERDKYGANDIKPGLTGLAQISGRDELPIEEKARLDGIYAQNITFAEDVKIFFGTIISVLKHDGVVEGSSKDKTKDAANV